MPKIFDRQFEGKQPKRINENLWFNQQQRLLLWMVNTDYGRDLLCIDKEFPKIVDISKKHITAVVGRQKDQIIKISEFRVGGKWANVIRFRWKEFQEYAQVYYALQHPFQFKMPVLLPVAPVPGFAYSDGPYFPDPDTETNTVDGYVINDPAEASWSTVHDAATGTASFDSLTIFRALVQTANTANLTKQIIRGFHLYNTANIPDGDTITAANIQLWMLSANRLDQITTGESSYNIGDCTGLVSNTALESADFDAVDNPSGVSTDFSTAKSFTTIGSNLGAYNTFTLNSDGRNNINKTGISLFAYREHTYDMSDVDPAEGDPAHINRQDCSAADETGTDQDPKLTVTHSVPGIASMRQLVGHGQGTR